MSTILSSVNYSYLPPQQLSQIARDRDLQLAEADVLSQIMPYGSQDGNAVTWDKQDDISGLLPVKGVGEPYAPLSVNGAGRWSIPASHYGGEIEVKADEIVSRAALSSTQLMALDDLWREKDTNLAVRQLQFLNMQRGQALATGSVDIFVKDENIVDRVVFSGFSDRIVTLTGGDKWDAPTTAAVIDQVGSWDADYFFGTGYDLSSGALLMSPRTAKLFRMTSQFKAFRGTIGQQFVSIADFNDRFAGEYPRIVVVKGSAKLRNGTVVPYLPDDYVVAVGSHNTRGIVAGQWVVTTNENSQLPQVFAAMDRRPNYPKLPFALRSIAGGVMMHSWMAQIRVFKVK